MESVNGNIIRTLRERGFIAVDPETGSEQITDPVVENACESGMLKCYAGFDPTASSLHVGNLLVIMALAHFQRHGHRPIALVGGATGMIGDPSGKSKERNLLSPENVAENMDGIRSQLSRFLNFDGGDGAALLVNNGDWLLPIGFVDFLRDVGKHFRLQYMLNKKSVSQRMSGEGLSFTEFAYMLMQAYDFLYLFDKYGCDVQIGGSDQWGNITAGTDLIWKLRQQKTCGIVFPLIEAASGQKFGKSEEGTVWLDRTLTSPFAFYQFWVRTDDRDAVRFLNFFTFLSRNDIDNLAAQSVQDPDSRAAQRTLAYEVTKYVHGDTVAQRQKSIASLLYEQVRAGELDSEILEELFSQVPTTEISRGRIANRFSVVDLLVEAKVCPSKSEAKRMITNGGAYLNGTRIADLGLEITSNSLVARQFVVLRMGKRNYHLVRFI